MKFVSRFRKKLARLGVSPKRYGENWLTDVRRSCDWSSPCLIMDVGANVGSVSKQLTKAFPHCQVHAFEPVTSTYASLLRNLRGKSRVSTHQLALSDSVETVVVTAARDAETNRIVASHELRNSGVEQVQTTTVDEFLAARGWPRVALLKIDTEGYDLRVLQGCRNAMSRHLVDLVLAECTFNPRGAPHVDALELLRFMRGNRYEVIAVYSDNVGRFTRGSGHSNILFGTSRSAGLKQAAA